MKSLSRVPLFATPWTVAYQDPLSMEFPGKNTGVGCHFLREHKLAFPETAWDMGYFNHLYFHLHLIKPNTAEWTLKVKGETVLDHVVFWFGCADQQVKTCQSPFSL